MNDDFYKPPSLIAWVMTATVIVTGVAALTDSEPLYAVVFCLILGGGGVAGAEVMRWLGRVLGRTGAEFGAGVREGFENAQAREEGRREISRGDP